MQQGTFDGVESPLPMTIQMLLTIRRFLTRVVARGPEEAELLQAIHAIDTVLENARQKQAA